MFYDHVGELICRRNTLLLGDFGTTWTKILDTATGTHQVMPTHEASHLSVDVATGHNAYHHAPCSINELLALVVGGLSRLGNGPWILVDVGSRDLKLVQVEDGRPVRMEWNNACGALTGFTLELLGRYFQLDFSRIQPADEPSAFTCGVFGIERLFDQIAQGSSIESAIARFVCGLARQTHAFLNRPQSFYLSGGMCENPLFLRSFPRGVDVHTLGRFLLLDGLLIESGVKR
jgi:activator of 2-hydroxyglutaryl-CoA dehydratase